MSIKSRWRRVTYRKPIWLDDIRNGFERVLSNKYPDYFVSGNIYYGYMDMTYFSFPPKSYKRTQFKSSNRLYSRKHLASKYGYQAIYRNVQKQYWELFRESGWNKYRIVPQDKGVDSILEHTLVENPDFSDTDKLTAEIEKGVLEFIADIEEFLSKN
jgi:hypothetical protein